MKDYNRFVKYAIEQYGRLAQEGSQLYKRHFVTIPFELKKYVGVEADADGERSALTNLLTGELKDLRVRFDAAFGSGGYVASDSNYMKIKNADGLGDGDIEKLGHDSSEDKYIAFIDAYSKNFVFIDVPDGHEARLNLLFSNSNRPLNTQVIVSVGDRSKLSVFELYASRAVSTSSLGAVHEVKVGRDSVVEINGLHNENANTVVLGFCKSEIGEGSTFRFNSLYNGGSCTRIRNRIEADGDRSNIGVNEMVLGSGEQKFDISTFIVNKGKETSSSLASKAALMDTSFCILKGFAKIEKGAGRSRSYVYERSILLDKSAGVDELPDMSVDENDVKAAHSSATAPVDAEAVFYLMSKGIEESGVRKLVVTGFFIDSLSRISDYVMRETSMSLIREKLKNKIFGQTPRTDITDMWVAGQNAAGDDIFRDHYRYRAQ